MKKNRTGIAVVLALMLTVVCASVANAQEIVEVKAIKLDKTKETLVLGQQLQLKATVSPENATYQALVWSSSNETVATVSGEGLVIPKASGTTTITCSAQDGSEKTATCAVVVPTILVKDTEVTITTPQAVKIPIEFTGEDLRAKSKGKGFTFDSSIKALYIWPKEVGEGSVTLTDTKDTKNNTVVIKIKVEPSAVFDTKLYPQRDTGGILHYIEDYVGQKIRISGPIIWTEDVWREGDGELDYAHRLLFVESKTTANEHGLRFRMRYLVRVPVTELTPRFVEGEQVEVCGIIAQGKANSVEGYSDWMADANLSLLRGWGFLRQSSGDNAGQSTDLNDSFYYIDADWCAYQK